MFDYAHIDYHPCCWVGLPTQCINASHAMEFGAAPSGDTCTFPQGCGLLVSLIFKVYQAAWSWRQSASPGGDAAIGGDIASWRESGGQ